MDTDAPTETTTASEESVSDSAACEAFGDVLTIVHNVEVAVHEGRMGEQEQAGWYRLATRVQGEISAPASVAVADALAAVKEAAPPLDPGAMTTPGISSDEWVSATDDLIAACAAAGVSVAAEGFTGG